MSAFDAATLAHVAKVIASDGPDEEDERVVEVMARAIAQAGFTDEYDAFDMGGEYNQRQWLEEASAALSAYRSHMREEVEL